MDEMTRLRAVEREAREAMSATRFPDAVLARVRLKRLLGIGDPQELDETEREWTRKKAEMEAAAAKKEAQPCA